MAPQADTVMNSSPSEDAEDVAIDRALREAVREALLMHKRAGNAIVVARDGQIVELPPHEIVVGEE